ncbi:lytic transglycosylase domain-containing protein [Catellatospora sp. KI3]|uniref:aggregation-promoting factor C-terminal-like domain-containing protein n=1 Tax=Catellatospora sp. KI3 TaxID=3041620 RepID=UPI00248264DE|nr:lytic transglycosylase domain-containing protein [Catellatospora sp. KI3]MDI1459905.1 lytic transglycosylase domain-containing protein [Catellatospora sp. KI3]
MSRPRRARRRRATPRGSIVLRAIALLTLLGGVAGGLYVDRFHDGQTGAANAGRLDAADAAEQQMLKDHIEDWLASTADERALQALAEARARAEAALAAARAAAAENEASRRGAGRTQNYGPIPSSCGAYSGNRAIGCAVLLSEGFGLDQMPCLDKLWTRESRWTITSENKSSGAYGIPQAVPGDKMAKFGDDWRTNPVTQIKWGLDYIQRRYQNPCKAWQHSEDQGWY